MMSKPVEQVTGINAADACSLNGIIGEKPLLLKGFVRAWPIVRAAATAFDELVTYLLKFDQGLVFEAMIAPPDVNGRLHYNTDMTGFNFRRQNGTFREAMKILVALKDRPNPPAFYLGSKAIVEHLPGLERENRVEALAASVVPNIWIGNKLTISTHKRRIPQYRLHRRWQQAFYAVPASAGRQPVYRPQQADTQRSTGQHGRFECAGF